MSKNKLALTGLTALIALTAGAHTAIAAPADTPHIAVVIDHSGSMRMEVRGFADLLETLTQPAPNAGSGYSPLDAAVYSVMSFEYDQDLQVDPAAPRRAETVAKELRNIQIGGGREDGYAALEAMLGQFYVETPLSIWLVTDEWRTVKATPIDFDGLLRLFETRNVTLHAIVRASFNCDDGTRAFGIVVDRSGPAQANASDWKVCERVDVLSASRGGRSNGEDRTVEEYVDLALASGGSAWDLEALARGLPAATDAFAQYQADALLKAASASTLQPAIHLATPAVVGEPVVIDASASGGAIAHYSWDLDGDGATDATGPIITHQFSKPGRYRVSVKAESYSGESAWTSLVLTLD